MINNYSLQPKQSTINAILLYAELFPIKKEKECDCLNKNLYLHSLNESMPLLNKKV